MFIRSVHRFSGIFIVFFVGLHLFNHFWSIFGAEEHIALMNAFRKVYRNVFAETLLLTSIGIQFISGIKLFAAKRTNVKNQWEKLQLWTGLYLLLFLFIHLCAICWGRFFLQVDTNFYFGAAGINRFPFNLFFIPYYALAIISFFGHIAAIHARKIHVNIFGLTPARQAKCILFIGLLFFIVIFYGFTNQFMGVQVPLPYDTMF